MNGSETSDEVTGNNYQPGSGEAQPLLNEPVKGYQSTNKNGEMDTQEVLDNATILINDPAALAEKYQGIKNIPVMLTVPPVVYKNGELKKFWVLNVDENLYENIEAKLAYQTPHVYFWIEEGVDFNLSDLKILVDNFEENIYPKNREIFGSEWSPGIDNDRHLTILYAHNLGGAAGYFSSSDSLMREVEKYSNIAEMFYLSADYIDLGDNYASGVLAHEFQHMIHWNIDRNEGSWVNEGLSELAVDLNDLDTGGFSSLFAYNPDIQLNFWPGNDQGDSTPHYGGSYLFMKYLFERFGEEFISGLIARPENGMRGLDELLSSMLDIDQASPLTSEQIFQDWAAANILQTDLVGDGIYRYGNNEVPVFSPIKSITCDSEPESFLVNQFGTDYYEILCNGDYEVSVNWDKNVKLHSQDPYSGNYYYWSNSGDESAMRLIRQFDLSDSSGLVEFSYRAWFDIERDYDYLYLNVSLDGKNWDNLETPRCTKEDPTGSNLGCGYNGRSNGWIEEIVDLTAYVGEKIFVEFEYVTDAAVNGEGFLLDDVKMDAVGFFDDFEDMDQ
ncbi:MAG: immune inhibitor A, partial [Pelolinea sp.]|nr:immune inhibitor A [Pelolinea sp.]